MTVAQGRMARLVKLRTCKPLHSSPCHVDNAITNNGNNLGSISTPDTSVARDLRSGLIFFAVLQQNPDDNFKVVSVAARRGKPESVLLAIG